MASCVLLPDSNVKIFAYRGEDLEKTLRDMSDIGYKGVELFLRDPDSLDRVMLDKLLQKTGLEVCGIGTSPMIAQDGLSLTNIDPDKRKRAVEGAKKLIDFASCYGKIPLGIGKFRGNLTVGRRAEGWSWMREAFMAICDYASQKNVLVALEPQERTNLNNINSTRDGVTWVEQIGAENLGLLLDTYHMNLEDPSVMAGFVEAAKYTMHVHISDTDRLAPGKGKIDFTNVMRTLRAIGYNGYLSVEISQPPDAFASAQQAWNYMNNIKNMY